MTAHTGREDRQSIQQAAAGWYAKMKAPQSGRAATLEFERWLAQNPLHELAYAQCRALWEITGSLKEDADIRREVAGARAAVERTGGSKALYRQVAAAVLVAVGLLFAAFFPRTDIYSTSVGEHRLVRLDDGSTAMLNTDTVIAVDYSANRRRIDLRKGEAYFDVKQDRQRPFEVQASASIVRAVGTEFNVMIRTRSVSVAVAEGLVEVEAEQDFAPRPIAQVKRGEAITYYNDLVIPEIEAADLERISAWKNSKIYFESDRLADAVAEYNRYTNRQIRILDKDLENQLVSGVFKVGDLRSFFFSLEQLLDVRVVSKKDHIYLMSKKLGRKGSPDSAGEKPGPVADGTRL